jgi:predicted  nucleic acid-binding Zn-ribbon protein
MNEKGNAARQARKLRASRDRWKQRSAEKQQQIRHLRVTVRDLSASREHWKARVKELEHQLQVLQSAQDSRGAGGPAVYIVFGGERLQRSMRATLPIPLCFPND